MNELDTFYLKQEEPLKSCFLVLRDLISDLSDDISEHWKYHVPFFYYKRKPFCYLWYDKKKGEPYIGVVKGEYLENPMLEKGNRKKMKILRVNPTSDIHADLLREILEQAMLHY